MTEENSIRKTAWFSWRPSFWKAWTLSRPKASRETRIASDRIVVDVPAVPRCRDVSAMRVAILGSCVSRDIFGFAPPPNLALGRYVARVSLTTMFAPPLPVSLPVVSDADSWERQMLHLELTKRSADYLFADDFDALLVDLVDERHSVWTVGDAASAWTAEFRRAGILEQRTREWTRVSPGSDEHQAMFVAGLQKLRERVGGRLVILNKVLPGCRYVDGEHAKLKRPEEFELLAHLLPTLYKIFEANISCETINYPEDSLVLPRRHKWGLAPYHYDQSVYELGSNRLSELLR